MWVPYMVPFTAFHVTNALTPAWLVIASSAGARAPLLDLENAISLVSLVMAMGYKFSGLMIWTTISRFNEPANGRVESASRGAKRNELERAVRRRKVEP